MNFTFPCFDIKSQTGQNALDLKLKFVQTVPADPVAVVAVAELFVLLLHGSAVELLVVAEVVHTAAGRRKGLK
jgi:hypothetical protein